MSLCGAGGYLPPVGDDALVVCGDAANGSAATATATNCSRRHPWHPPRPADGTTHPYNTTTSTSSSSSSPPSSSPHAPLLARGQLLLRNTLTGRKEAFVPSKPGRAVRWYACGPTVYDSAHVGHARTYLSLDICRRIMSDYLNYDVLFQINTTDVDDKIILRARQDELMRRLEDRLCGVATAGTTPATTTTTAATTTTTSQQTLTTNASIKELRDTVREALAEAFKKSDLERTQIVEALTKAKTEKDGRGKAEQEGLLEQHAKKRNNLENEKSDIDKALATDVDADANDKDIQNDPNAAIKTLMAAAKSVLAAKLDREFGHTVTDKSIFDAHARKYEREFMEDMAALGIREPDVLTRVTEYVPKIVDFVQRIVDRGLAYKSRGSVYLDLQAFEAKGHNYRKLHPAGKGAADGANTNTTHAEMAEGEGALNTTTTDGDKRGPNDFALWKASRAGEPAWESPFGPGRPGWHIECSVVAGDILGEQIDIHSGGEDLKFPHHDNELAQSEACFGCHQWVNYFTHTGHLHIEGLKMSKSLKNFVTIKQALAHSSARQLRIMFLLQNWDQPMNYSDQTVHDAQTKEATLKNFFREVQALVRGTDWLRGPAGWTNDNNDNNIDKPKPDRRLAHSYLAARGQVHERLLDNFDTKGVMLALTGIVADANAYLRDPAVLHPSVPLLRAVATYVTRILKVFGVVDGADDFGFGTASKGGAATANVDGTHDSTPALIEPFAEAMVDFRGRVRDAALAAAKRTNEKGETPSAEEAIQNILRICDELRDGALPGLGIRLEDRPSGAMWTMDDPEVMKQEIKEKKNREREVRVSKLEKRIAAREKEAEKVKSSAVRPEDLFKDAKEYAMWDDDGVPTKNADGTDISGGQKKKKKKAIDRQKKAYGDLMEKSGGDVEGYMDSVEREVEDMRAQLAKLLLAEEEV